MQKYTIYFIYTNKQQSIFASTLYRTKAYIRIPKEKTHPSIERFTASQLLFGYFSRILSVELSMSFGMI